jgi:hypothetical protein
MRGDGGAAAGAAIVLRQSQPLALRVASTTRDTLVSALLLQILNKRKGFVRIALQTGAKLVPVIGGVLAASGSACGWAALRVHVPRLQQPATCVHTQHTQTTAFFFLHHAHHTLRTHIIEQGLARTTCTTSVSRGRCAAHSCGSPSPSLASRCPCPTDWGCCGVSGCWLSVLPVLCMFCREPRLACASHHTTNAHLSTHMHNTHTHTHTPLRPRADALPQAPHHRRGPPGRV